MKLKSTELDLTALMSEVTFGHGYAHYGYFPDGVPEVLSAQAVGAAQHAYLEKLVEAIGTVPGGVARILDVGSGTGANARALDRTRLRRGMPFPLGPDERDGARETAAGHGGDGRHLRNLSQQQPVRSLSFRGELSLHRPGAGLAQAAVYAGKGVVIFDYFRRPGHAHTDGTRGTHADFRAEVAAQGAFEILSDEDLTDAITPTFVIHEYLKNEKIAPFVQRLRAEMKQTYPWRAWALEKVLGRSLDKLGRQTGRATRFAQEHEYRLIVMRRLD
jgi:hypothetical protein